MHKMSCGLNILSNDIYKDQRKKHTKTLQQNLSNLNILLLFLNEYIFYTKKGEIMK